MQQLESILESVLETEQVPFDIRGEWGRQQAVRNPKGQSAYHSLAGLMPLCGQWMDLYGPGYVYRADLRLFLDCFREHRFAQACGYGAQGGSCDSASAASLYNDFVGYLGEQAERRGVRKSLSDRRANLADQASSVRRYLGGLTCDYRVLVPIRRI